MQMCVCTGGSMWVCVRTPHKSKSRSHPSSTVSEAGPLMIHTRWGELPRISSAMPGCKCYLIERYHQWPQPLIAQFQTMQLSQKQCADESSKCKGHVQVASLRYVVSHVWCWQVKRDGSKSYQSDDSSLATASAK
eukprot:689136-Pleurochrysis_carterae.AAC.1